MNTQRLLKEKGLKTTVARVAVLDLLEKQEDPADVLTIVQKLNNQADQATIYRILEVLTRKGVITRIEFGEGKYRYELAGDHHHHLVCTKCGRIEDVEGEYLKDLESQIRKEKGFLVKSHSLEFFGLCKNCQS